MRNIQSYIFNLLLAAALVSRPNPQLIMLPKFCDLANAPLAKNDSGKEGVAQLGEPVFLQLGKTGAALVVVVGVIGKGLHDG